MMLQEPFLRRKRFGFLRNSGSTGRVSLAKLVAVSLMFSGVKMMAVIDGTEINNDAPRLTIGPDGEVYCR